jgi:hypothetical protein
MGRAGDILRVLHETIGADHSAGEDGDRGFGGSVGGADGGEDDGESAAHGAEEGLEEFV